MELLPEAVGEDMVLHGLNSLPEVRAGSSESVGEQLQAGGQEEDWLPGSGDRHPRAAWKDYAMSFKIRTAF